MTKTLINRLKGAAKKAVLVGALASGLSVIAGCPTPIPNPTPIENRVPTALVYAQPASGEYPLSSQITVDGTDPDGKNDIKEYQMEIDYNADGSIEESHTSPVPITLTRDFNANATIYGQVKDSAGHINKNSTLINVSAPDYVDITGRLEDCENDGTPRQGIVRIYNAVDNSLLDEQAVNGNFSITLDEKVSELSDGIIIKAQTMNGSNPSSYVRTVKPNMNQAAEPDVDAGNVRVVPYPTFDTDKDGIVNNTDYTNFKTFMSNMNVTFSKWNLDNLNKIRIYKHNGSAEFSDSQVSAIIAKISSSNDIEKFVAGKNLDSYVEVIDAYAPAGFESNNIIVVPNTSEDNKTYRQKAGRTIVGTRIELYPAGISGDATAVTHEFGHAFIAPDGEADGTGGIYPAINDEFTIMNAYPNGTVPKAADIKASKIVYDDSYQAGESLEDILGSGF